MTRRSKNKSKCTYCNKLFYLHRNSKGFINHFCSILCMKKYRKINQNTTRYKCSNCTKKFYRFPSQVKDINKLFCCQSCAGKYNSSHRTKGNTRSKLEIWLEIELIKIYPKLNIHFNRKDAIMSELDIYIPSLELAFELNGIFHYEPIFGQEKLNSIKSNDNRKFQACLEHGIELCIIDTTDIKYLKDHKCQKYLDIIRSIIDSKI